MKFLLARIHICSMTTIMMVASLCESNKACMALVVSGNILWGAVMSRWGICNSLIARIAVIVFLVGLGGCSTTSEAQPVSLPRLVKEGLTLPAQFKRADGSTYTVNLDGIVIRPDDGKVHPLVVLNHGYERHSENVYADGMRFRAAEFARRGWVVVEFTRRGFGLSEGSMIETMGSCEEPEFARVGKESAADIREVIRLMVQKPYVDASKVISVGQGAGGYATLALTADPPSGLAAAIVFSAGRLVDPPLQASCFNRSLIGAVKTIGKSSRVPILWFQAESDHSISLELAQQMYKAFNDAGGNAEFITAPAFKNVGSDLFRDGFSIWTPCVDTFLQKHGLKQIDEMLPVTDIRVDYSKS